MNRSNKVTEITKEIKFEILNSNSAVANKVKDFFTDNGYKIDSLNHNEFNFSKGSKLKNMVTFNPLKWKNSVHVTLSDSIINAKFSIDTSSQLVTTKEEELWNIFVKSFESFMTNDIGYKDKLSKELRSTYFSSFKYVGSAILGAIIFGIPSGMIAFLTGFDGIMVPGAVAGSIYFMHKRNHSQRNKKS